MEIDLNNWEEFEKELKKLEAERARREKATGRASSEFLFRGQYNPSWPLETTLERYGAERMPFAEYYRVISRVRPQVETFTGRTWNIGEYQQVARSLRQYDRLRLGEIPAYSYMVYLRHHGFPSPLLDWTRSPYIAAYFAFRSRRDADAKVTIYAYWAQPEGIKKISGTRPHIYTLGPYVRTHRRHFLQQSDYTICVSYDREWRFAPHSEVFDRADSKQDLLWKINIPSDERPRVLKMLDKYNLNAFSLFETDDSLIETMALRELEFREKDE